MALERLLDHAGHVLLGRDVRADAAVGWVEIGDDHRRALRLEPACDRGADPLRAASDDRDLAVERTHHRSGENAVGTRIRFCCVCMSGCTFARNACQRGSAWRRARFSSRSAYES